MSDDESIASCICHLVHDPVKSLLVRAFKPFYLIKYSVIEQALHHHNDHHSTNGQVHMVYTVMTSIWFA